MAYLTNGEAQALSLTDRLKLNKGRNPREYLASVARPKGGSVIMEALRIVKRTPEGYFVDEITNKEMRDLRIKYEHGIGQAFEFTQRAAQRI